MLNIFYIYSVLWGSVALLYNLGFSDMNQNIDAGLNSFFIISIIVGIILGRLNKEIYVYTENKEADIHPPIGGIVFIIIFGIADIIYAGDIPLFAIISGRRLYGEFNGLPVVHSLVVNASIFYSAYFFYIYLEKKNRKSFILACVPLIYLLLLFLKGATIMCLLTFLNLFLAKKRLHKKIFNSKNILIVVISGILIAYLNGGLTNLRSQRAWNDSSLIMSVGEINEKWPIWLPKQFAWLYSYVTSPLANLNLNIINPPRVYSSAHFLLAFIPIIISKNLFPQYGKLVDEYRLHTPVLNACTGFIDAATAAGIIGIYCFTSLLFLLLFIISRYIKKRSKTRNKEGVSNVYYAVMCTLIVFMFFYNTFRDASTSLLLLFIIFDFSRVKFFLKWRK